MLVRAIAFPLALTRGMRARDESPYMADYGESQRTLDGQLDPRWDRRLDAFLPAVFPVMKKILVSRPACYRTLLQSEWTRKTL